MTSKEKILDAIIEKIENEKLLPWQKPYFGDCLPYNIKTNAIYNGVNTLALTFFWGNYNRSGFLTYKQASDMGANVIKGSKGTRLIYFNVKEIEDEKGNKKNVPFANTFVVFHESQIEGLPEREHVEPEKRDVAEFVSGLPINITFGMRPMYRRVTDEVCVPALDECKSEDEYYNMLFHEIVHWTGVEGRMNRIMGKEFGDSDYSHEELVAQIGAAFLMAHFGLRTVTNNDASYIQGWLKVLKGDKNMLFSAASQAQKAVDFILNGCKVKE